jgi:hypothetical protein
VLYLIKDLLEDSRDMQERQRHTEGHDKINKSFFIFNAAKIGVLLYGFLLQISRMFAISRTALLYVRSGVTVS